MARKNLIEIPAPRALDEVLSWLTRVIPRINDTFSNAVFGQGGGADSVARNDAQIARRAARDAQTSAQNAVSTAATAQAAAGNAAQNASEAKAIAAGKLGRIATDESLSGNGTEEAPLGVAALNYEPVNCSADGTDFSGHLSGIDVALGGILQRLGAAEQTITELLDRISTLEGTENA
jgi:hypothetical protein